MAPVDSLPPAAIIAIVTIPSPRLAPDWYIARRMRATIPQYAAAPGIRWKAYTQASNPRIFGGVYEWVNREAADRWFDAAWRERIRKTYRPGGGVRLFTVVAGIDAAVLPDAPQTTFPGIAIVRHIPPSGVAALGGTLDHLKGRAGLIFGRVLRSEGGRTAILSVWASEDFAEAGMARDRVPAADPALADERYRSPIFLPPAAVRKVPTP